MSEAADYDDLNEIAALAMVTDAELATPGRGRHRRPGQARWSARVHRGQSLAPARYGRHPKAPAKLMGE